MASGDRQRRTPLQVILLGYLALVMTWVFGNPPFAAPDEWAHYLRAISVAQGEIIGEEARYEPPGLEEPQLSWVNQASTEVDVPEGLSPAGYGCHAFRPEQSAACQYDAPEDPPATVEVTTVGNYQPLLYWLPGIAVTMEDDAPTALRWGRVVSGLFVLTALGFSLWTLTEHESELASVSGLLVAVTPMAVFLAASLSPSGGEVWFAICFSAALFTIAVWEVDKPLLWAIVGVSGFLLALSRSTGPVWIVIIGCAALLTLGWEGVRDRWRNGGWHFGLAISLVGIGMILNRIWEAMYGPQLTLDLSPVGPSLVNAVSLLPGVFQQEVGVFGYLDTVMPTIGYVTWYLMVLLLFVLAYLVGNRRQRISALLLALSAVLVPVLLHAAIFRHTGFYIHGRNVLPIAVSVPIYAGFVLARRFYRLGDAAPTNLLVLVGSVVGSVHLLAWLSNARRSAVGAAGPIEFVSAAEWRPPGGWLLWLIVATIGSCALIVGSIWTTRNHPMAE